MRAWVKRKCEQRRVQRELLCQRLLAYLQEHGPTLYATITHDLNCGFGQLQRVGQDLKRAGKLYVGRAREGHDSRRVWSLTPIVKEPAKPRPVAKPRAKEPIETSGIGIDAEDIAWMQYYQIPRAERRAMELRK